jgi:hypothetical protein
MRFAGFLFNKCEADALRSLGEGGLPRTHQNKQPAANADAAMAGGRVSGAEPQRETRRCKEAVRWLP